MVLDLKKLKSILGKTKTLNEMWVQCSMCKGSLVVAQRSDQFLSNGSREISKSKDFSSGFWRINRSFPVKQGGISAFQEKAAVSTKLEIE